MKKTFTILTLMLALAAYAGAQEFTLYGEGFIPTGRFAKSTQFLESDGSYYPVCAITEGNNFLGGGGNGWGAGFQVATSMGGIRCMDWIIDCGFRMGWVNGDLQEYFDNYAHSFGYEEITQAPKYYNIPLMIGPRATFDLTDNIGIFGSLQLGANIRIISDAIYTPSLFVDYETACTLAFRAAIGLLFFDHLRIEANWSWLGDDIVSATMFDNGVPQSGVFGNLETMHAALRVGWTF